MLIYLYSLMLGKFTNAIVKSRPLKEIGAEQVTPAYLLRLYALTFPSAPYRPSNSESILAQDAGRISLDIQVCPSVWIVIFLAEVLQ
jgi:hypothetical protein